jgi:hypothetical protein
LPLFQCLYFQYFREEPTFFAIPPLHHFSFQSLPSLSELFYPFQFFHGIIKADMCVHVHRNIDVRMPHEILKGLRIHSRFCHIRTIRVAANMRCNVWHLLSADYLSGNTIIYNNTSKLESKWVLYQNVIIHCHLKSWSKHTLYGENGTVTLAILLLQFY